LLVIEISLLVISGVPRKNHVSLQDRPAITLCFVGCIPLVWSILNG